MPRQASALSPTWRFFAKYKDEVASIQKNQLLALSYGKNAEKIHNKKLYINKLSTIAKRQLHRQHFTNFTITFLTIGRRTSYVQRLNQQVHKYKKAFSGAVQLEAVFADCNF